jgi:putative sigma-54 modulation protein
MLMELHTSGVSMEKGLREHIERRLSFALSRFGANVMKAIVTLADTNGPKGGVDKSCRIVIRVRGIGEVVADVIDTEWLIAVDRATNRIGHSVARGLERRRDIIHESLVGR